MDDVVLTLIGPDRPGLVQSVAKVVADHGGNWLESRMAHLAGQFAGVLRVEVPRERAAALAAALDRLSTEGLRIVVASPAAAAAAGSARALDLELVGLDRPGLVRQISDVLAAAGANVEELHTDRENAPMSGGVLFRARARVHLPAGASIESLRAACERLASDLVVDLRVADLGAPGRR